jgi:hypothetical protein
VIKVKVAGIKALPVMNEDLAEMQNASGFSSTGVTIQ